MPIHEERLIAEAALGMPEALTELYERFAPSLLGLAIRLTGSRSDGEDVLHDVFLGLPEALRHYQERGALSSWLHRVIARVALTRMRIERRRRETSLTAENQDAATPQPDAFESTAPLERLIRALPDRLRVVFVLKEIAGYSHREIASLLGISTAASEVRLCRAAKLLRSQLRNER